MRVTASGAAYMRRLRGRIRECSGRENYGIPVKGPQRASWVICPSIRVGRFEEYANAMPNNAFFLVDT